MRLISGLTEGQVLQRLGKRGADVTLEIESAEKAPLYATIAKAGRALPKWKRRVLKPVRGRVNLSAIPAGGPYRLQLECGRERLVVRSFYVGDVWVLAGQSNMEGVAAMPGRAKPHPLIRAFSMRREWRAASEPLFVLRESPDPRHYAERQFNPEEAEQYRRTARTGSGAGLAFGHEMLKHSGVPQGLMCVAHGGTSMAQWDPALRDKGGESLYGSMLLSIRACEQPVAGILWYQGESDAAPQLVPLYRERMRALIAATRRDLKQPKLPWVIVQLARAYGNIEPASWNAIQEEQRLLPSHIPNLETVAAVDLAMDDQIHIGAAGFPILANRLARAADRLVNGNKREKRPPQLREVIAPGADAVTSQIDVVFDHVVGGLRSGGEPFGFSLIGPSGNVLPAIYKTTLHGDRVRLHLGPGYAAGAVLHHGHGLAPYCNIIDERGEALPVFGPVPLHPREAFLPFITTWKKTEVIESAVPLAKIARPDVDKLGGVVKTYVRNNLVNEHTAWIGRKGHNYFSAEIDLPEAMKLQFRIGYDGPIRLWLDDSLFFEDLAGTNPAVVEKNRKTEDVSKGRHRITVGMDINNGLAWGFYLRFQRVDLTPAQVKAGGYAVPSYSVRGII
jgi:sialate O-acetylesterase